MRIEKISILTKAKAGHPSKVREHQTPSIAKLGPNLKRNLLLPARLLKALPLEYTRINKSRRVV